MTCADKLRTLHAVWSDGGDIKLFAARDWWRVRDLEAEVEIIGTRWFARHDMAKRASAEALAALSARLDGAS